MNKNRIPAFLDETNVSTDWINDEIFYDFDIDLTNKDFTDMFVILDDDNEIKEYICGVNYNSKSNVVVFDILTKNATIKKLINNRIDNFIKEIKENENSDDEYILTVYKTIKNDKIELKFWWQQTIRLSESQFKHLIKESVKQIIEQYIVTMSNKGMEGLNNLSNFNQAVAELNKNGYVELSMKMDNQNIISCSIEKLDNKNYVLSIEGNEEFCDSVNDALVAFKNYCKNKQNINEAFSDIVQHDNLFAMTNKYNMYQSYVLIDNYDLSVIDTYTDGYEAVKEAKKLEAFNKYGSYSVIGCIDDTYDLDDEKTKIYTTEQ